MAKFDENSFSLKGKVALITGGARGLGKYYSIALSTYGADILLSVENKMDGKKFKKLSKTMAKELSF